jgi:Dolichyl-phosphate-mannose-protein mannosyltransferase
MFVLSIPLVLSAYTHLWNPLGFPSIHIDESHYMRRAMLVIQGMGPQESAATGYQRTYDHPYFGQIFLGGVLRLIGYPNLLKPVSDQHSVELLYMVPRLLMGLLAILDTFLIFKIAERRYGMAVGLIASVFFAVMPMTWILRRIYLDTILMPFMLSSILFALYLRPSDNTTKDPENTKSKISQGTLILLSGIFLGLAIYTKAPAFTMIPLVGSFVFFNSKKRFKSLGIWLIPVIIFPLLWPLYAVVVDQSDLWFEWVIWQTGRNRPLSISLTNFAQIDPVITIIGIAGFIWTGFKKDFFPLLWVGPFLIFSYFIGWVQYFHLIVIFPAFCIGSAVLINDIQRFIRKRLILRSGSMLLSQVPFIIVSLFGLVILTILITSNVNSSYYRIYASIASNIPDVSNASGNNSNVTLVGSHWWVWSSYWITQYVLGKHHELVDPHLDPNFKLPLTTKNVIYIDDNKFLESISRKVQSNSLYQIKKLHDESAIRSTFIDNVTSADDGRYPNNIFSIMILNENHPVGQVVIKRNF